MARYLALVNTPGYLPWDDEPPVFTEPGEAWQYLVEHRERAYDPEGAPEDEEGLTALREAQERAVPDTLVLDSPGYDGEHDLGLAYTVTQAEQRAATPEEAAAYLAGQQDFPGAEETEHGLLLPV